MARPGRRRAAPALLAVLAVAAALLGAVPAGAATPSPADTAQTGVQVVVTTLLPRAPTASDQAVQVAGRVVNGTSEPVRDVEVVLQVGDVLRSRSALAMATATPPRARTRAAGTAPEAADLDPGSETPFDLRTTVGALGLGRLGVYPVQVTARGRVGDGRRTVDLATASTFVPWFPDGPPAPTRVSFLWPLVDAPALAPDDAVLGGALDAALRAGSGGAPAGRLAALLAAGRAGAAGGCDPAPGAGTPSADAPDAGCRQAAVPLTWAVDPGLLEAVDVLAREHAVLDGQDRRTAPASAEAQRWLQDLRSAVGEGALLALPYGDPDVVALTRQRSGLADDLDQLRLLGQRTAAQVSGAQPLQGVAWPPPGRLTSAALDASLGGGATAVVLDEQALPVQPALARSPGARTELSSASAGRVTGLVVDGALSSLLSATGADTGWQGARLAEQRWLVETAMIAAERPGESRSFLVAPPRRGAVDPAVAAEVLRDAGRLPWLCPVALADLAGGGERCAAEPESAAPARPEARGDLAAPDPAPSGQGVLPASYVADVARVRARGTQLTDEVLVAGSDAAAAVKARFLRSRGRAVSSAWRDDAPDGRRLFALYRDDVESYRGKVRVSASETYTLTSDSAPIDVSIVNALDQPVTVGVQLNDPVEARLTSTDTAVRTIGPSEVVPVRVRVQTRTSGQFVVRATLRDRSGQPFGDGAELVVRSTGYGRLALAITGVGAGLLLAAAGVRVVRRALRRQMPPPAPS